MIPILYEQGETLFQSNGIGRLADAISCTVTEQRNGAYTLEMVYPLTGVHYSDIQIGRIIFARHSDNINPQPFRICRISRPLSGLVTISANHISYDLCEIPIMPFAAEGIQATFEAIPHNTAVSCPFTFWTDKTTGNTYTLTAPMSVRAMLGGVQGSILDVFGGADYEFDKFAVKLHLRRGSDKGVSIRYGKNLTDLTRETDADGTYSAVIPFYQDNATGELLLLPERILDISGVQTYEGTYTNEDGATYDNGTEAYSGVYSPTKVVTLDLSEQWETMPTVDQLRAKAQTYIANNAKTAPVESVHVSFVALWQTEEYKDVAPLQRTEMGDTVHVYYGPLGVDLTMRVVQTVYNCLLERYDSIELGNAAYTVNQAVKGISTQAAQIAGRVAAQQAASAATSIVKKQTDLITGQTGGYFVVDTDGTGKPVGWLIMDTADKSTARHVIRANASGIGFSANGYEGPYVSAWTIDGQFNADFIQTGTLLANLIKAGILSDTAGKFYLNMETGELVMQDGTFTGTVNAEAGNVGGFTIDADSLDYEDPDTGFDFHITPNADGICLQISDVFYVSYAGQVGCDRIYSHGGIFAEGDPGGMQSMSFLYSGVWLNRYETGANYAAKLSPETKSTDGVRLFVPDDTPFTLRTVSVYQSTGGHYLKAKNDAITSDMDITTTGAITADSLTADQLAVSGPISGSTSETLSGTYNGLTITLYKNAGAVTCYIRGTTTADFATGNGYVDIFTPADSSWMPAAQLISYQLLNNAPYRGQIAATTTKVRLGYTRNNANTQVNLPSGTNVYVYVTWAAK